MPNHLPREARQVLAELELCMHGRTASLNPSTKGGDDPSRPPQGESSPPHLVWAEKFREALDAGEPIPVGSARRELEQIRGWGRADAPKPVGESEEQRWARMLREGEGHDARAVAVKFHTSVRVITRKRSADGRDPNDGTRLRPLGDDLAGKRERVNQLRQGGCSTREIARLVGVHQTQVVRWTKEAA